MTNPNRILAKRYGGTDTAAKRRMAEELRTTLSTVNRWCAGTVAMPHAVAELLKCWEQREDDKR